MLPLGGFVVSLHSVFMRFMLFISIISASNVVSETIYVRLNPQPFSSPFYIFSSTENGPSVTITLNRGSTYEFIRSDLGHPFNIGSGWRIANPSILTSSTSSDSRYMVSEVGSIELGDKLTLTIPNNFAGNSITYYCYSHSSMVAKLTVVGPSNSLGGTSSESIDLDGNGSFDALTDGLLLLRGMFLLSGNALVSDAVASDAVYKTSDEVASRIEMLGDLVDIDGNGNVDALTDGLVILRYLFNLRGDVLINDVIASDATVRTAEDIEDKIENLMTFSGPAAISEETLRRRAGAAVSAAVTL
jgi:hypothetical protein